MAARPTSPANWWPWLLWGLILTASYGYHWLAKLSSDPDRAARWLYQMGLAVEFGSVCAVVLWKLLAASSGWVRAGIVLAASQGLLEASQTVLCDAAAWGQWPVIANSTNICEHEWGQWPYKIVASAAFAALVAGAMYGNSGSEGSTLRRWYLSGVAHCRHLGAVTRAAAVRAYQAIRYYLRN